MMSESQWRVGLYDQQGYYTAKNLYILLANDISASKYSAVYKQDSVPYPEELKAAYYLNGWMYGASGYTQTFMDELKDCWADQDGLRQLIDDMVAD